MHKSTRKLNYFCLNAFLICEKKVPSKLFQIYVTVLLFFVLKRTFPVCHIFKGLVLIIIIHESHLALNEKVCKVIIGYDMLHLRTIWLPYSLSTREKLRVSWRLNETLYCTEAGKNSHQCRFPRNTWIFPSNEGSEHVRVFCFLFRHNQDEQ